MTKVWDVLPDHVAECKNSFRTVTVWLEHKSHRDEDPVYEFLKIYKKDVKVLSVFWELH